MMKTRTPIAAPVPGSFLAAFLVILALGAAAIAPSAPAAESSSLLWQNCESGSSAGQCEVPRGIVADPSNGHLYVTDQANSRIVELDAWGQFVKAWGWGVRDGSAALQTCTVISGCREGLPGGGPGEFGAAEGLALDSAGDVYVADVTNHRVQKFDPGAPGEAAKFLLTFGGDVNKTKVEELGSSEAERNLCAQASSDVCQAGAEGTGAGQFGEWPVSSFIAVGPGDVIYVGDVGRVQRFNTGGEYQGTFPDPSGLLSGETVYSLAVAPSGAPNEGSLYLSFKAPPPQVFYEIPKERVVEFNSAGEEVCAAKVKWPTALASDSDGGIHVVDGGEQREFGLNCAEVLSFPTGLDVVRGPLDFGLGFSTGIATSSACGIAGVDVYVPNSVQKGTLSWNRDAGSFVRAFGPPPDSTICPPPAVAPDITAQYARSVTATTATLGADINPHFWPDATYYLEYGTGKCSEGGCTATALFPGAALGGGTTDAPLPTKGALLAGLLPATTYHYRFVAKSSGGGPVQGAEASFTTFPAAPTSPGADSCPNSTFRTGASARLPGCRAYEMVSPVDKEGGDVATLSSFEASRAARLDQASSDGERLTYSSYRAFAGSQAAPYTSQYLSSRQVGEGWSTAPISPPSEGTSIYKTPGEYPENDLASLDTHYKAFSDDLCHGWMLQDTAPALTADALPGFPNLYQREDCRAPAYEALTTDQPQVKPAEFVPAIQGFSADGSRVFFRAKGKLTSGASLPPQLYERFAGSLTSICVLPSGVPYADRCGAGTTEGSELGNRISSLYRAVSSDGARVFWSDAEGRLYLRENPEQPPSTVSAGKCTEAEKACTVAVSAGPAFFWSAATDGSAAIFSSGGDLYRVGISAKNIKTTTEIAHEVRGVMGASEDARRVYFVSKEGLSANPNSAGTVAQAGKPNLYLYEAAKAGGPSFTFIGTLSSLDDSQGPGQPSPIAPIPINRAARVSPDGTDATFMSTASLTGYDNTDQHSGEADAEVFIYDAGADKLACVSCNPAGARPIGSQLLLVGGNLAAAAQIPGWENQFHPTRVLSDNGDSLFFDSFEALVPADTNGAQDVYQWESASSQTGCGEVGAELYVASASGCLSLISSGESPSGSEFIDASADGNDVFFTTTASLLPQDPGLIDLYDARVGGGFAPPPGQPAACEGEACQGPLTPPNDPTPASSTFHGAGNVRKTPPALCAKGKVRRKGRCGPKAKKHHKRAHRAAKTNRGGSK